MGRPVSNNRVTLMCSYCGAQFSRLKSKLKNSRSGLYFCQRECKDLGQTIESGITEIQPNHYKTGIYSYREKAFKSYPNKCNRCGYDTNMDILVVHHKDRNRSNNFKDNLEILCPNCHAIEHLGV